MIAALLISMLLRSAEVTYESFELPGYTHWTIEPTGETVYCAKTSMGRVSVMSLDVKSGKKVQMCQLDVGDLTGVAAANGWVAVTGTSRIAMLKVAEPQKVWLADLNVSVLLFVDRASGNLAYAFCDDGSAFRLNPARESLSVARLKATLDHGVHRNNPVLNVKGKEIILPNQEVVLDTKSDVYRDLDTSFPIATVYDCWSGIVAGNRYVRSRASYSKGESSHITWASSELLLGTVSSNLTVSEVVINGNWGRILNCALSERLEAWLEVLPQESNKPGLNLVKLKLPPDRL